MRYFFFFLFLSVFSVSCKPPVPVYFDNPVGIKLQGFDTELTGNYFMLDDIIEKNERNFSDKYDIKYDKIVLKDTSSAINLNEKDINYDEIKNLIGNGKDSAKTPIEINCDSSVCKFNKLVVDKFGSNEESSRDVAGIIKIMYDKAIAISIDSSGVNHYDTIVKLDKNTLLTNYAGKYYLNIRTPYGWEIIQMELWEKKFMSVRPYYFTTYDRCAQTVSALVASAKSIYPNLSPIVQNKKVIGFRAVMNPKYLMEGFKKSESPMLMMKLN